VEHPGKCPLASTVKHTAQKSECQLIPQLLILIVTAVKIGKPLQFLSHSPIPGLHPWTPPLGYTPNANFWHRHWKRHFT